MIKTIQNNDSNEIIDMKEESVLVDNIPETTDGNRGDEGVLEGAIIKDVDENLSDTDEDDVSKSL
jgi:hypothetical protein